MCRGSRPGSQFRALRKALRAIQRLPSARSVVIRGVPSSASSIAGSQLYGISERGDKYPRTLLIRGARFVLIRVSGKLDARSRWLQEPIALRGLYQSMRCARRQERAHHSGTFGHRSDIQTFCTGRFMKALRL